jgi:uncharacterized membrane protein
MTRALMFITTITLFAALEMPVRIIAQGQQQAQQVQGYTVTDLGPLGGTYSQAFYVNSNGVASGEASMADGNWHAILWQSGLKRDLGTLGGLNSSAFGSPNKRGQVVGEAETSYSDPNGEDFCGFFASGAPLSGTTCLGF